MVGVHRACTVRVPPEGDGSDCSTFPWVSLALCGGDDSELTDEVALGCEAVVCWTKTSAARRRSRPPDGIKASWQRLGLTAVSTCTQYAPCIIAGHFGRFGHHSGWLERDQGAVAWRRVGTYDDMKSTVSTGLQLLLGKVEKQHTLGPQRLSRAAW